MDFQFAQRANRNTEDAIAHVLQMALSHLDGREIYVKMLFVDYSAVFHTIIPSRLVYQLRDLGLNISTRNWILDFLRDHPQMLRGAGHTSCTLSLSIGASQSCVLSPLLDLPYTTQTPNHVVQFSNDTAVMGLLSDGDGLAHRQEVAVLEQWCMDNPPLPKCLENQGGHSGEGAHL